jgi:hypothetical protein
MRIHGYAQIGKEVATPKKPAVTGTRTGEITKPRSATSVEA